MVAPATRYKQTLRVCRFCLTLAAALPIGARAQNKPAAKPAPTPKTASKTASKPAAQKPPVPETAESIARIIIDPKNKREVVYKAYERISFLSEPDQIKVMRELVTYAPPIYTGDTARVLVERDDVAAVPLIAQKMNRWSQDEQQRILLQISRNYAAPLPRAQLPTTITPYLPIVRQAALYLLRPGVAAKASNGEEKVPDTEFRNKSVYDLPDVTAQLLAEGEDPSDKKTLRALLSQYPNSFGVWQYAARAGVVTEADVAPARSVYSNPNKNEALRLAAAVAVVDYAPDAEKYVSGYIAELMTLYKDQSHTPKNALEATDSPNQQEAVKKMWEDMSTPAGLEAAKKQLKAWEVYNDRLVSLSTLRNLSPAKLTPIVAQAMQGENPEISYAVVSAALWVMPSSLLSTPARTLPEDKFQSLYASMVIYYPELRAQAEAIVPEAQLNKAIEARRARLERYLPKPPKQTPGQGVPNK